MVASELHRFWWGFFLSPATLVSHAKDQLQEFQKAKEGRRVTNVHCNRPQCVKWEQPKEGYIKLNWDVAINRTTRRMGAGLLHEMKMDWWLQPCPQVGRVSRILQQLRQ